MKSKNVIISLVFVLGLLVYIFMKIRSEPRKKLIFNRNPSRIEYTQFALCRMDCYGINANTITSIFRTGEANRAKSKGTCPIFSLRTLTKQGMNIIITVQQCGTVARIVDCSNVNAAMPCNCADKENQPILYLKIPANAFTA